MADIQKPLNFRVIIAGGGISGLTLANALQHAGVDYLLLEARPDIAPQVGASLGVAPNGNRILDQLSCYEDIEKLTEPVEWVGNHDAEGNDLAPRSDWFKLVHTRTNYPVCFLDRQIVLRILAEHISDRRKILLNKRVLSVEHSTKLVIVRCKDGSLYHGDIIAGADGVFSKVRQEMWRAADAAEPGAISENEKKCLFAEYRCLYGISGPVKGLKIRNFEVTYKKDISTMVITGKGGRVFWFLFNRMPQVCRSGSIPRFDQSEAVRFAEKNLDLPILPEGIVKFDNVWKKRMTFTLTAIEEADYANWTWGRFACLGDSVHKMTPNTGSGGMAAIESAAALANAIHSLLSRDGSGKPSLEDIRQALKSYQQNQKARTSKVIKAANDATRIQALKGVRELIIARFVTPVASDLLADMGTDYWIGSTMLNYLPPPPRSLLGTMPFNPSQGLCKHESTLRRAILALIFPMLGVWCFYILFSLLPYSHWAEILKSGRIDLGENSYVPILETFYGVKILDTIIQHAALVLAPSSFGFDRISSHQMFTFLADSGLVYSIMLVESSRRANMFKPASLPFIFGMLSTHGIGVFFPLYYFLHYTLSPISVFAASDKRLTDHASTITVLPVMSLAYYTTFFLSYCAPDPLLRHKAVWTWHLFPVWASLGQSILKLTLLPSTIQKDRLYNVKRDLWAVRVTVGTLTALSAAVWLYTLSTVSASSSLSLFKLFVPTGEDLHTYVGAIRDFLIWDHIFFSVSSILWILYLFNDLKHAGMVRHSWGAVLGFLVAFSVIGGPGVATAVGWLWREEVLASKRHKDAVVEGWKVKESNGISGMDKHLLRRQKLE